MGDSYISEFMELPKPINLPADTEISDDLIKKIIKVMEKDAERYQVLQGYYEGKAKIYDRDKDPTKSNNKLVLPYPSYIVDLLLGLFVGKPVSYTVADEFKEMMIAVQDVFDLNDEQDENTELAKMIGIKGEGREIVYLDEEGQVRFNEVEPENLRIIYDDAIIPKPIFAIYIRSYVDAENFDKESKDKLVTVYTDEAIKEYKLEGSDLKLIEEGANLFGEIPVIDYKNNDEGIGDFERVIPLIDAINLSQSDTANDFEEFTNAILLLNGMPQIDSEDVNQLLEDRVIALMDGQGASWLIKNINDVALENYKLRLDSDIHKHAKVPNMADEHFAGNVSGEAMKYKLFATDQIIAQKQRKFKTALQKRIRLILNILNIKGASDFDYRDISVVFNDNKPYNELDNINTVKLALDAGLSKTYAYSKLRDIDDVAEEIERQAQEKEEAYQTYADSFLADTKEDEDVEDEG